MEHKECKEILAKYFQTAGKEIELEYQTIDNKRRIDLFCRPNLAIEVQCSYLTTSKLKERHIHYGNLGLNDFWFVGHSYQKFRNLKSFYHYQQKLGFYYLIVNYKTRKLECHYCLTNYSYTKKVQVLETLESLRQINKQLQIYHHDLACERKYYTQALKRPKHFWHLIKAEWYVRRLEIEKYLDLLFLPVAVPTLTKYDELILKSQILFQLLGYEEVLPKIDDFIFIKAETYLQLYQQQYLQQIKSYLKQPTNLVNFLV